jgi:hypothetical protein
MDLAAANRTTERALGLLGALEPHLKMSLLSMRAITMSVSGDVSNAASLLAEARALRKGTEDPLITAASDRIEAHCRQQLMQFEQAVKGARRVAETYRATGDLWAASDVEWVVGFEMYLGRTAEAAEYLPLAP